ncbi:MAG TPA: cyclase family protein [Candidatus Izemoplasmatales bacterium]|nr:cyclase family protein [Bacillota bacterium]HRY77531.1 cyclase family protein [Candidatus Izemoplasmatales bacterium]
MKEMRWIDLSRELSDGMPVYPGDPGVRMETLRTVARDQYHMESLSACMHAGTHLDAPKHFLETGGDVTTIPLEITAGPANFLSVLPQGGILRTADLRSAFATLKDKHPRLILSVGWDKHWGMPEYFTDYPGFEPDFGAFLTENGIVLFGWDAPSVKYGSSDQRAAHRDLLGRKIVILEGLVGLNRLPDSFFLVAMPLKLRGGDGSLVRAAAGVVETATGHGKSI